MFISRNAEGNIVLSSEEQSIECREFLDNDSAEWKQYLQDAEFTSQSLLAQSDQTMARVLEDVINLLVDKGTIRFTDLPIAAQSKLLSRRELRGQKTGMDLLDDGDDLDI